MIKAIIFDMDGLLIDSEPFWKSAEIEVFQPLGVPLTVEMCWDTVGLRIDEVVEYWYEKHPWTGATLKSVEDAIVNKVIELILSEGKAMPGVHQVIEFFKKQELPISVASSSYLRIIDAALTKLDIKHLFQVIHSAELEPYGKPHPGIFITTATKLGVKPHECLVLEDSLNGVISARAARMKVIAVPEETKPEFAIATLELNSLEDFGEKEWKMLN